MTEPIDIRITPEVVKCVYCEKENQLNQLELSLGVSSCECGVSTLKTDKGWTKGVWRKTSQSLEEMCKRCGDCCHEKLNGNGRIYIFMKNACPWLDTDLQGRTRCLCYESRLDGEKGCMGLKEAIDKQILPIDCGYRDMFPKSYVPPKRVNSLRELGIE